MTRWPVLIGTVGAVALAATFIVPESNRPSDDTTALASMQAGDAVLPIWQCVGSDGSADERSKPKEQYSGYRASVKSTGTVELRYNVQPVDVDELVNGVTLGVRFRDNGNKARVRVRLRALDIVDGSHETLVTFDSNDFSASPHGQFAEVDACGVTFDFVNYVYYMEAALDRQNGNGKPALDAMQLMGLSCDG